MTLRDYTLLGMTQSLCPQCLALVPAKIIVKDERRVYFRKRCPTHGVREDFVCSDAAWYDRMEFSLPGRLPRHGLKPLRERPQQSANLLARGLALGSGGGGCGSPGTVSAVDGSSMIGFSCCKPSSARA